MSNSSLPVSEILLTPLSTLQSLSQSLFLSLSPSQTKPAQSPSISSFVSVDEQLAHALILAQTHQVKQRKIEALKEEVLALEKEWREVMEVLERARRVLAQDVEEGKERIKAIEDARRASVPYPELLAYAQWISAFTSAPPNMPDLTYPGQPPPPLFFPPFPNEEKMRKGKLNAEAPLGLLGEMHDVGRPPSVPPKEDRRQVQIGQPGINPYRPDNRPPPEFFDLDLDLNPDL